jgi:hypothetical protein
MEKTPLKTPLLRMTEDTKQIGLIGVLILIFFALVLFFGRECNRENTKESQLRREARLKCISSGKDPWQCSQAFR